MSGATRPSVTHDNGAVRIRVPMELKRRGGRKQVIIPEGIARRPMPVRRSVNPLAVALARALRWQQLLDEGACPSMSALAEKMGVDGRYAARLLDLTLLAPDIIESILTGREPDGMSLQKLFPVPMEWDAQRRALEFTSSSG